MREIHHLTGQLLIAMPSMRDQRFERTVIYICVHSMEGAMGLVINRACDSVRFKDLLRQLKIPTKEDVTHIRVHYGGPIDSGRGFVLHSTDFFRQGTMKMQDEIALTVTNDIIKAMAEGQGPKYSLLALGYAGWGPGQLDDEIRSNGWLYTYPDSNLLFDPELETKWERSIEKVGIQNLYSLSSYCGYA